jgi:AmiR/NasT family two-component response regulator
MKTENPTEEYLYQAKIVKALREDSLKEIVNEQAKLYAKQRELEQQLESANKDIEHWVNVLAMEKLKANIQLASS